MTWDAATEELEGDVLAVLGNILTVRFGDDWRNAAPQPASVDREALADLIFDNLEVDCNLTDEAVLKVADALLARYHVTPKE